MKISFGLPLHLDANSRLELFVTYITWISNVIVSPFNKSEKVLPNIFSSFLNRALQAALIE